MAIHIEFREHRKKKTVAVDYTFVNRHNGTELAFGTYSKGMFELMDLQNGSIERFKSAAVAWTHLNQKLTNEYGY